MFLWREEAKVTRSQKGRGLRLLSDYQSITEVKELGLARESPQ